METKLFFLVSSLLLSSIHPTIPTQDQQNPERTSLFSFKNTLENPDLLPSWLPSTPHCQWQGILCKNNLIISLSLPSLSLKGPLSPTLFSLPNLILLDLSQNLLSGQLPSTLSNLRRVRELSLGDNHFTGQIPPEIGQLTQLESLELGPNFFTGRIPPELGNLTRLKYLDLGGNSLIGNIPVEFQNLSHLLLLDLANNFLSGVISSNLISSLVTLTSLDVSNNSFSGALPPEIGRLLNLTDLSIGINRFSGNLPREIGRLSKLQNFFSASCSISGPLPEEFSDLISLTMLDLSNNPLKSSIPKSIGKLQNLTILNLAQSEINGSIPPEIGKCKNLKTVMFSFNSLSGSLPKEIFDLPMISFSAEKNQLSGNLPAWIGKWREINSIMLGSNSFTGRIPPEIGNCSLLNQISLRNNLFSGSIPSEICNGKSIQEIDLDSNFLWGTIENTFLNCRKLSQLVLVNNQIGGRIPEYLSELPLMVLDLDSNNFTGKIPLNLWNSIHLMEFSAANNLLEGEIPVEIGNAVALQRLVLSNNMLQGRIPKEIGKLKALSVLSLNSDYLEGEIPLELGECTGLTTLDLGNNRLNGPIPESLGNLTQLQCLVLSHNELSGVIPSKTMSYFQQVTIPESSFVQHHGVFDLSYNMLTGPIPEELGSCVVVVDLLISNNQLSENRLGGLVPTSGICLNFTKMSLLGNKDLCGGTSGLDCEMKSLRPRILNVWGLVLVIGGSLFVAISMVYMFSKLKISGGDNRTSTKAEDESKLNSSIEPNICFLSTSRSKEPLSINVATFEQPLLRLTLVDILEATNNFCNANIIGEGGFGTVYKATLPDGRTVAVKKLSEAKTQGHREFLAEMETLGKVKHRNLVPLLGYCSFGEEKLLVYEYMINGSVDLWLRSRAGALEVLDWPKRVKIAVGAARGLSFLHHGFIPHIIHRDIKASNILLDADFEPKVADFGLARLISAYETHVSTDIAGTFGYIPPEYGQSWKSTTRGDVYSFGVILLELVTGREPTGPDFKEVEGGNLVGWVFRKVEKGEATDVIDPAIVNTASTQKMLQMVQIALICLSGNPANRPTMLHVLKFLKGIEEE
ncbi:uncharacterized protein LOC143888110 isoform X2 [Tasmannia lanceolata]|uniref:uncharacterized protein LOC143888110 isoform X2 n=1 Tax=Tasmannia lanceolata TaxID=3420 RepID=UPI004063F890